MPTEVILPRVDMDMASGRISRWFAEDSATVEKGAVLFEIETDKAAMDVDAPASGTLRRLPVEGGPDIPVGSVVALIYGPGEAVADAHAAAGAGEPAAPPQDAQGSPAPRAAPGGAVLRSPQADGGQDAPATREQDEPAGADPSRSRLRATPLARRLASESGIALEALQGSGPRGRIQSRDVEQAAAALASAPGSEAREPAWLWLRKGEGVPVVAIHGFGADLQGWRPFLPALPERLSVLGIDLPGHGRAATTTAKSLDDLAQAVEAGIAAAGPREVHLVGHSLGSAVAAAVAARGRVAVRSLMLMSPAGLGPEIDGDFIAGFLRARSAPSLRPWLERLFAGPSPVLEPMLKTVLRQRGGGDAAEALAALSAALFPDGTQGFSIRPWLAGLTMPVKIVHGTLDRIIPARHAAGVPGRVALHLFPGVGHMPHVEAADDVAALLQELLRASP